MSYFRDITGIHNLHILKQKQKNYLKDITCNKFLIKQMYNNIYFKTN